MLAPHSRREHECGEDSRVISPRLTSALFRVGFFGASQRARGKGRGVPTTYSPLLIIIYFFNCVLFYYL